MIAVVHCKQSMEWCTGRDMNATPQWWCVTVPVGNGGLFSKNVQDSKIVRD